MVEFLLGSRTWVMRFVENTYKTMTVMLVILGWLLSSEAARRLLHEERVILAFSILLIGHAAISISIGIYQS